MQDSWTNQVLGTSRRVRRMFELTSLHLPSTPTPPPSHVAHTASIFPLSFWHSRLGHVSVQKLCSLISSGFLGQVKHLTVYLVSWPNNQLYLLIIMTVFSCLFLFDSL